MNKAVVPLTLTINDQMRRMDVAPGEKLIDTLRRHGYKSIKFGCGEGMCGSCTVLVDGRPHLACLTFTQQMEGRQITTVEGLGKFGELHPLQQAFLEEGAVQCGYCTPGMILASHALLARDPDPSDDAIRRALDGNKCRCTGYAAIIRAVRRAARMLAPSACSSRARRTRR
mgnify:CR=1 FL=1